MKQRILVIAAAVVLCGAVAYSVARLSFPRGGDERGKGDDGQPDKAGETMRLVPGKRYRMMVLAARVPERKPDGQEWDRDGKGNLPDPFFILRTPDHYYKSPVVKDCLSPNWADKSLSIQDLWSGRIRAANEGALFVYAPGSRSRFYLHFKDSDLLADDDIGSVVFSMDDVKPGITQNKVPAADLVFTLRVIPDDL